MNSFPLPSTLALEDIQRCPKPVSPKAIPNVHRRSSRSRYCLTYAEWITRALLSSKDKCSSLADIYEWMAFNVPGLYEQRFLHSSKGWKNAVRHTLSINPRFRKLKRFGKPSLWTLGEDYLRQTDVLSKMNDIRPRVLSPGFDRQSPDKKDGAKHVGFGQSTSPIGAYSQRFGPGSHSSDWATLSDQFSHTAPASMQLPTVSSLHNPYHPLSMGSIPQFQPGGLVRQQQDYQRFLASLVTPKADLASFPPTSPTRQLSNALSAPKSPTQVLQVANLNGSETSFVLPRPLPMGCLTDQKLFLASLLWPNGLLEANQ